MSWSLPETVCWECPERGLELVHLNSECVSPRVRLPRKPGQPCPRPIPALPLGSSTVSGSVFPPRAIRASPSHLITGVLSDFLGLKKAFIAFGSCGWWSQSLVQWPGFLSRLSRQSCPFPRPQCPHGWNEGFGGDHHHGLCQQWLSGILQGGLLNHGEVALASNLSVLTVQVWVNGPPAPSQLNSLFPSIIFLSS